MSSHLHRWQTNDPNTVLPTLSCGLNCRPELWTILQMSHSHRTKPFSESLPASLLLCRPISWLCSDFLTQTKVGSVYCWTTSLWEKKDPHLWNERLLSFNLNQAEYLVLVVVPAVVVSKQMVNVEAWVLWKVWQELSDNIHQPQLWLLLNKPLIITIIMYIIKCSPVFSLGSGTE